MTSWNFWYLNWQGRPVGKEDVIRKHFDSYHKAEDFAHEALRGTNYTAKKSGEAWFYYSDKRKLLGVLSPDPKELSPDSEG